MKSTLILTLSLAVLGTALMDEAQAAPWVTIQLRNSTRKTVRFKVKNGRGVLIFDSAHHGDRIVSPGEVVAMTGNAKKFKITAGVWNRKRNRWDFTKTQVHTYTNTGRNFRVEFFRTNNGTQFKLRKY